MTLPKPRVARRSLWIFGALSAAMIAVPAFASDNIFVQPDGIVGDSLKVGFLNQLEVDSISIGYSSPIGLTGASGGKTLVFAPVTISKKFDKSTPVLMQAGGNGQVFKTITISMAKSVAGGGTLDVLQKITLSDAQITEWRLVDSAPGSAPIEQVTFVPQAITVTSTPSNAIGGKGPTVIGTVSLK